MANLDINSPILSDVPDIVVRYRSSRTDAAIAVNLEFLEKERLGPPVVKQSSQIENSIILNH